MQLSAASLPPEINSAVPVPVPGSGVADLAPPPGVADGSQNVRGAFAFLFPNLAPGAPEAVASGKKKADAANLVVASPGCGSRRTGSNPSRPSVRRDGRTVAASGPVPVLSVAPAPWAQSAPVMPPLEMPDVPRAGTPSGEMKSAGLPAPSVPTAALPLASSPSGVTIRANRVDPSPPVLPIGQGAGSVHTPPVAGAPSPAGPGAILPAEAKAREDRLAGSAPVAAAQGEKIAEAGAPFDRGNDSGGRGSDKKILNVLTKQVAGHDSGFGTDVAKPASIMPVPTPFRQPPPGSEPGLLANAAAAPTGLPSMPASAPAAATSAAHRAVEAVLSAADRVGSGEQHAVNLQFSFSDADLAVRVELREGAVHTTFRTDSSELRSALAHEWQAVSSEASDHPLRLAEPVFAANEGAGLGSSAGDTARQQRDAGGRPAMEPFSPSTSRPAAGSSGPSTGEIPGAAESARRSTTLHLQTFA